MPIVVLTLFVFHFFFSLVFFCLKYQNAEQAARVFTPDLMPFTSSWHFRKEEVLKNLSKWFFFGLLPLKRVSKSFNRVSGRAAMTLQTHVHERWIQRL